MTKSQLWMSTGAMVCAVLGGAIVWSIMTFTIVRRADLADYKADQVALGECVVSKSAAHDTAEKARAEAELLKAK